MEIYVSGVGYCPHPVTFYIRSHLTGSIHMIIQLDCKFHPTVTARGSTQGMDTLHGNSVDLGSAGMFGDILLRG